MIYPTSNFPVVITRQLLVQTQKAEQLKTKAELTLFNS